MKLLIAFLLLTGLCFGQMKAPKCKDVEGLLVTNETEDVPYNYTGVLKMCLENGQLSEKGNFVEGRPEGEYIRYYENGNLEVKGNYLSGMEQGEWQYYKEDGTWEKTVTCKNDERIKCEGNCD